MQDPASELTEDRLARLQKARDVATQLEDSLGNGHESTINKINMRLQKAGSLVRKNQFDRLY